MKSLILYIIFLCLPFFAVGQTWETTYKQADSLMQIRLFKESIPLYENALQLAEKEFGRESGNYLKTSNGLGRSLVNFNFQSRDKTEPFLLENKELAKRVVGENHPDYAYSLMNLGIFYPQDREKYATQAVEIYKANKAENRYDYALALNLLANVYGFANPNYPLAESLYKAGLRITKGIYGEKHITYTSLLNSLSSLYSSMGNYDMSISTAKNGLELLKEIYGEKSFDYAFSLNNLSLKYRYLGNYEMAEKTCKQAVLTLKEVNGAKDHYYGWTLNNLAEIYQLTNRLTEAEALFEEVIQVQKEAVGEKSSSYYSYLERFANFYSEIGRYKKSDSLFQEVSRLKKLSPIYGFDMNTTILKDFAYLYGSTQKNDSALVYYRKALDNATKVGVKNMNLFLPIANQYAQFLQKVKKTKQADSLFTTLKNVALSNTLNNFPVMSEKEKVDFYTNTIRPILDNFNSFASSYSPSSKGDMYDLQLATKALLLNSSAKWKSNIMNSGDKRLVTKFLEWEGQKKELTRLYQQTNVSTTLIDSLENQNNELERQLSKISERFSKLSDKKIRTWQEIKGKLVQGEATIEVVRVQKSGIYKVVTDSSDVNLPQYPQYGLTDTVQYAFLVVTPQSKQPELIMMENGNEMEKQIKAYRNGIKFKLSDKNSYNLYWKKIGDYLAKNKVNKVYFSPDGVYHQISMNTLKNPQTQKYVLDEVELVQMTNTKDLLNEKEEETANQYAVLLGNPEFNLRASPLPATQKEVVTIAESLKKNQWEAEVKEGKEATENSIKELFKPRVLHIATHGYFEPTYAKTVDEYNGKNQLVRNNPLWHSGLLLSQTPDNIKVDEFSAIDKNNDGILTAYEAMNLNLDGTELVVLSACETGLGEIKYGEGVYGLQRAFQVAGAKNVLMSLWKVSDEATQELMTTFYDEWLKTNDARKAFKNTQYILRTKYKDPYFWGSFVLVGN